MNTSNPSIKIGRAFIKWSSDKLLRFKTFLFLSRFNPLIRNLRLYYSLASRIIGQRRVNNIINFLYGDIFIGGKDEGELQKTLNQLNKNGILTISDYAIEFINDNEEGLINENVIKFKNCIDLTVKNNENNMIAIKLSSLSTISYLKFMNSLQTLLYIIEDKLTLSGYDFKSKLNEDDLKIRDILIKSLYLINEEILNISFSVSSILNSLDIDLLVKTIKVFEEIGETNKSKEFRFNIYDLIVILSEKEKINLVLDYIHNSIILNEDEIHEIIRKTIQLNYNIEEVIKYSNTKKCHLMVDAEQTYIQKYIDYIMMSLFRKFNVDRSNISTTIQFYLRSAHENCNKTIQFCKDNNVFFGIKMVRGAYNNEERRIAALYQIPDPICKCQFNSDINYNNGISNILSKLNKGSQVIIASHNLQSISHLNEVYRTYDVKGEVIVAQLLGMGENASWLAHNYGFKSAKYVPYGDLDILLPYLFRRAEESSIVSKIKVQNELINNEFISRTRIKDII